jgi:5'-3' exonuclease
MEEIMILIIDGSHLAYRSFHAFERLTNSQGYPTGMAYGFFYTLMSIMGKYTNRVIITWEGGKTWRKEIYPEYKASRKEKDDNFIQCLNDLRELCKLAGIIQMAKKGYESDDSIAFLTRVFEHDIKILTGDKDLLQLVDDSKRISVLRPHPKKDTIDYNESVVLEQIGVRPIDIPLYLSLLGDKSDNISGLMGYGKVKAAKLINNEVDPARKIRDMFPAFNLDLNLSLIDLNFANKILKVEDNDIFCEEPNIYSLGQKIWKLEFQKINSKSLVDTCYNESFQNEFRRKINEYR